VRTTSQPSVSAKGFFLCSLTLLQFPKGFFLFKGDYTSLADLDATEFASGDGVVNRISSDTPTFGEFLNSEGAFRFKYLHCCTPVLQCLRLRAKYKVRREDGRAMSQSQLLSQSLDLFSECGISNYFLAVSICICRIVGFAINFLRS